MTSTDDDLVGMEHYLKKTYKKTASLMANSSKAVSIIGGHPSKVPHPTLSFSQLCLRSVIWLSITEDI